MENAKSIPVCLTVAGSDSGGGAGIQADLRTFTALGCFGLSAITAATAQNPRQVTAIRPIPAADVVAQCRAVTSAFEIAAIKTGMLFSAEIIAALAAELAGLATSAPLVLDPVMVATSGAKLLEDDAIASLRQDMLPLAAVITPNLPEAEILAGRTLTDADNVAAAARELALAHAAAVLIKGGHTQDREAEDLLAADGKLYRLTTPVAAAASTHGTGCTLSAAIAAGLARSQSLLAAVVAAKAFVYHSLTGCRQVGPDLYAMFPPATIDESIVQVQQL